MRRPSNKDYYGVLGVSKTASSEEIKDAYRTLCKTHHPDVGGDAEKMKDINEAYSVLSDEGKRAEYDNPPFQQPQNPFAGGSPFEFHFGGGNPFGSAGGINLNDILSNLHGFRFTSGGPQAHFQRTSVIRQTISISLIKALTGGDITIDVPQIGKTIQFPLPRGVQSHSNYKVRIGGDPNNHIILALTVIVDLPIDLSKEKVEQIKEILEPIQFHTTEGFRSGSSA